MAVNVEKLFSAGLDSIYAGLLNSNSRFAGSAATHSDGDDDGGFKVIGANSADVSVPENERVNVPGDDGRLGTFLFDSETETGFTFEAGANDMAVAGASQGSNVYAIGDWDIGLIRPGTRTPQQMAWVINTQAKSQESASSGQAGFHVIVLPKIEVTYLGPSGIANRQAHSFRYSAVVNPSTIYPWGLALSNSNEGDTETDAMEFYAENRVRLHFFQGDGVTTTFTLSSLPAGADTTNKVLIWVDGTQATKTTDYTVATATGVVTWQAGHIPASAEEAIAAYEFTA